MLLLNKYLKAGKLLVFLLLFKSAISQNLIQNGSFENYTNPIDCNGGGFINGSFPHNQVVDNWNIYNTPDYFNSVCTNTYTGMPINLFGNSFPKQGNAYAGCILFAANYEIKEYIYISN